MGLFLGLLLYVNILLITLLYLYLFKIRKLIGFQLGMNISMMAGGFLSITSGVILIFQFPLHFVTVTVCTTLIGMITGGLFGALFDYQTLLTGYSNGLMMGLMSPMIGAAANTSFLFLYLTETVFITSIILLATSARYS